MSEQPPDDGPDDALLARLRHALADPAPDDVVAAAHAAFLGRELEAELAELVSDSDDADLAGGLVRGAATGDRILSFESANLTVDLEVSGDVRARRILGQVSGPAVAVRIRRGRAGAPVEVDDSGQFEVADVGPGPVRFEIQGADGRWVTTTWTTV